MQKPLEIPKKIKETIDYVIEYTEGSSNDYLVLRKEIIRLLPPKLRSFFGRRHYSSKRTVLSKGDYAVKHYWEETTGMTLLIDKSLLHNFKTWNKNPKGWGIQRYNDERKRKKSSKENNL